MDDWQANPLSAYSVAQSWPATHIKPFKICAGLKSLAEAYLLVKEKRDTEVFVALRAKQDVYT